MSKKHYYLLLSVFIVAFGCKEEESRPVKPNIILINVDDIGYGDFEPYGQELIKTPHISRMFDEGAHFTNFYAGSTVCGPSRAALLTGLHTGHLRSCGNGQDSLSLLFETWPNLMQDNGYRTGMFGKQHLALLDGSEVLGDSPLDRGFDEFVGWLNAEDAHQHFVDGKTNGWSRRDYMFKSMEDGGIIPHYIAPDRFVQNEFLDHGLEFIKENQDTSFFLYLPFTIGHAEVAIPKAGEPDYNDKKYNGLLEQYLDEDGKSIFPEFDYQGDKIYARPNPYKTRATFAAMISHLDRDIGELLQLLKELQLEKNTLVILTSDNGPSDEGGIDEQQIDGKLESPFNSSGGLRGFKRSLHDGGIRVPMIAWWPGRIESGLKVDQYYANYDIGPTILELSDSEDLKDTDGVSFLPQLLQQENPKQHEFLYWEWRNKQAVRFDNWKVVRKQNNSEMDSVELYDIVNDPSELVDLSSDPTYISIVNRAKTYLNQESTGVGCNFVKLKV